MIRSLFLPDTMRPRSFKRGFSCLIVILEYVEDSRFIVAAAIEAGARLHGLLKLFLVGRGVTIAEEWLILLEVLSQQNAGIWRFWINGTYLIAKIGTSPHVAVNFAEECRRMPRLPRIAVDCRDCRRMPTNAEDLHSKHSEIFMGVRNWRDWILREICWDVP